MLSAEDADVVKLIAGVDDGKPVTAMTEGAAGSGLAAAAIGRARPSQQGRARTTGAAYQWPRRVPSGVTTKSVISGTNVRHPPSSIEPITLTGPWTALCQNT